MYLFVTTLSGNDEDGWWHTPIPHYGDIAIQSEEERARLVAEFEKAVREQIVPPVRKVQPAP